MRKMSCTIILHVVLHLNIIYPINATLNQAISYELLISNDTNSIQDVFMYGDKN